MLDTIALGLRHSVSQRIDRSMTAPAVSLEFGGLADMPPVFATTSMAGAVEAACIEALKPYLEPGEVTVGTRLDLTHTAPTPVGMTVTAEVDLIGIDGRRMRFAVTCRDEAGPIGEGHHERIVVDRTRFMDRANARRPA